MAVRQLSIFMENKAGRITEITETLANAGTNIRGFVVSDTAQFGIVRVIVDNTDVGLKALTDAGFTVSVNDVLVVDLADDHPGILSAVLKDISAAGVNVEYAYSLVSRLLAISAEDVDTAQKLLQDSSITLLAEADIEAL
jgi:hypothetical protein